MTVNPGAVVAIKEQADSRELATRGLEQAEGRELPTWLALDRKTFAGELIRVPSREDIAPIVDEQLVVELYSK